MEDVVRPSKRKLSHVSRACQGCRQRKIRCDGQQPECTSCSKVGQRCIWSNGEDGRKNGGLARSRAAAERRAAERRTEGTSASSSFSALTGTATVAGGGGGSSSTEVGQLQSRVNTLRKQVLSLERALSKRGVSVIEALQEDGFFDKGGGDEVEEDDRYTTSPASTSGTVPLRSLSQSLTSAQPDDQTNNDETESDTAAEMEQLHMDDHSTLTLSHFGPSSALNHLNVAPASLQSPVSFERGAAAARIRPRGTNLPPGSEQKLDWSRNLPSIGISEDTHETLLELCEAFFTPWCWVVNFDKFREDMRLCLSWPSESQEPPPRTAFYSPLLHNIILAQGACLWHGDRMRSPFPHVIPSTSASAGTDNANAAADALAEHARIFFDVECERPMLSTVNGLLLLASFHSGRARPNLGHVFFTTAVTTCHSLGLNIDSSKFVTKGLITPSVKYHRDQLFWTVYIQDELWSMAIGRFGSIAADAHNVAVPAVEPAYDKTPWKPPRLWSGSLPFRSTPGLYSTCHLELLKLARIQNAILKKCYSLRPKVGAKLDVATLASLQTELRHWHEALPESMRLDEPMPTPHVITMHLNYNYAIMLLNRPVWQRMYAAEPDNAAIRECNEAAVRTVELLGLYDSMYGVNYAPLSSLQTTFVAGTVHLMKALEAMKRDDASMLQSALRGSHICIAALDKASLSWYTAARISKILQSLFERWLPGSVECMQRLNGTDPIPRDFLSDADRRTSLNPLSTEPPHQAFHTSEPFPGSSSFSVLQNPPSAPSTEAPSGFASDADLLSDLLQMRPSTAVPVFDPVFEHPTHAFATGDGPPLELSSFDFSIEAFDEMLRASGVDLSM